VELANASDDRVVHKTNYHSGLRASKAVMMAKKMNGSGYRVLADSMIDVVSVADRNIMTQGSGFNQKQYHIPPIQSQVPVRQIKDLIGYDLNVTQDTQNFSRAYSDVINVKQQYMIKNSSLSLPLTLTIHLVKFKDRSVAQTSLNSIFVRTFYNSADWASGGGDDYTLVRKGYVPKYLQHSPVIYTGDGTMQSAAVTVSNKLKSLSYSPNFRFGCNVVESFTKTLPPGDYWNFSHTHHCGSGIDIEAIFRTTNAGVETESLGDNVVGDSENLPFTYGVIFEAKGRTVEAYEVTAGAGLNTYLGSSPTYYSYEYKTSAYFAAATPDSSRGNDNNRVTTPGYRVYQMESALRDFGTLGPNREKFIDQTDIYSTILDQTDTANVGKAFIPMATSVASSAQQYEGLRIPG